MSGRAEQAKPENAAGLSPVALAKAGGFFQHSMRVKSRSAGIYPHIKISAQSRNLECSYRSLRDMHRSRLFFTHLIINIHKGFGLSKTR